MSMSDNPRVTGCVKAAGKYDKALNHVAGNRKLQEFLGNNLMVSLFKIVYPDDRTRLQELLDQCTGKEEGPELIRMMDGEEQYHKCLVKASFDTEEQLYNIEIVDAEECEEVIDWLSDDIQVMRALLTVENNILFRYDGETELFKMFWISNNQDIVIYEMPLKEWKARMLELGYVEGKDNVQVFEKVCEDIAGIRSGSNYTFRGKIITKGDRIDTNRIKFMPVSASSEQEKNLVVGRWDLVNEVTSETLEDFCEESYMDPLTGLLNKKTITERAKELMAEGKNERIALAMMDLDNFKQVNDTFGHMFGDEVLKTAGQIIKEAVSGVAVAGRMGGDEFFLVFPDYVDELHLRNVLRTIKLNIAAMYQGKIGDINLSCSIGASRSDVDSTSYNELFKVADKALYIAKQKGKNRYIIYKTELHGEFKFDGNETQIEVKEDYYVGEDIREISSMLNRAIVSGDSRIKPLLSHMVRTFHFDRAGVYLDNGKETVYEYREPGISPGSGTMVASNRYLERFKNDLLFVENINHFEFSIPDVYHLFRDTETKSSIQILVRDRQEQVIGLISFDCCQGYLTFPKDLVRYMTVYGEIFAGIVAVEEEKRIG